VVDDQEAYGVGLANYFTTEFQAKGGVILGRDGIPFDSAGAAKIQGLAEKIAAARPAAVFYAGVTSGGGGKLRAQLKQDGYNGPMLTGDGVTYDDQFIQDAGASAANGTYGTFTGPDPSTFSSGARAQFISNYQAAFPGQEAGFYSAESYDAAMMIITAIKSLIQHGQDPTRDGVIDTVQNLQYDGITGHINFDQFGDNSHPVYTFYKVQNGQWAFVKEVDL
jgi:branched-chain amino acid transport system substrate-binding protein